MIQENKKLLNQIDLLQTKIDKLLEKKSELKRTATEETVRRLHFKFGTHRNNSRSN